MQTSIRKADRVSDDLLRRIVAGDIEVGDLLPKEAELADAYQVNRSVIREAIKLLEVHRLVRPIKRKGTEVLDPQTSLSPEVLRAMLRPKPGFIDADVLADLLEIRAQLDVQMCTLAAERRTEADLEAMDLCLQRMAEVGEDIHAYGRAQSEFSLVLARATQNRIFQMLVRWHERVHADLGDLMSVIRQPGGPHLQGAGFLVELIRQGDVQAANTMMSAFHRWATPRLLAAAALRSGVSLENVI